MRLLLAVIVWAATFPISLYANKLTLDSRFDNTTTDYNNEARVSGSKNSATFSGSRLRMLYTAQVVDELGFKLRLNLLSANDTPNSEAKFSKFVDYAFLTHQLSPSLYLSAGKVIALIGGREAINNPGDYYFVSMAGSEILARPLTVLWPVGAVFGIVHNDQKLELLAANTSHDDGTAQSRSMIGLSYLGSFLDKKILPIASYHQDAENENVEKRTYLSIGSKFIFDGWDLELDYLNNAKSYQVWTTSSSKDTTSLVSSVRYKHSDLIHAILKFDSSVDKVSSTAGANPSFSDTKYQQVGLGVEYYPIQGTRFRYHCAVVQKTTIPESGASLSETKFVLGVRLIHDFIK